MRPRIKYAGLRKGSPAVGTRRDGGKNLRSVAIRFDDETFDVIRNRAVIHRTTFAEQVRLLVERGLAAEEATERVNELQRKRA